MMPQYKQITESTPYTAVPRIPSPTVTPAGFTPAAVPRAPTPHARIFLAEIPDIRGTYQLDGSDLSRELSQKVDNTETWIKGKQDEDSNVPPQGLAYNTSKYNPEAFNCERPEIKGAERPMFSMPDKEAPRRFFGPAPSTYQSLPEKFRPREGGSRNVDGTYENPDQMQDHAASPSSMAGPSNLDGNDISREKTHISEVYKKVEGSKEPAKDKPYSDAPVREYNWYRAAATQYKPERVDSTKYQAERVERPDFKMPVDNYVGPPPSDYRDELGRKKWEKNFGVDGTLELASDKHLDETCTANPELETLPTQLDGNDVSRERGYTTRMETETNKMESFVNDKIPEIKGEIGGNKERSIYPYYGKDSSTTDSYRIANPRTETGRAMGRFLGPLSGSESEEK